MTIAPAVLGSDQCSDNNDQRRGHRCADESGYHHDAKNVAVHFMKRWTCAYVAWRDPWSPTTRLNWKPRPLSKLNQV
jgi:hypothetical protein